MHTSPMETILALDAVTRELRSAQPGSPVVVERRPSRPRGRSRTALRRRTAALLHTLARTLEPVESSPLQCSVAPR
jgi:hypothetical protein